MLTKPLARLLYLANCSPPHAGRTEFYAMKDRLLRRYGQPDGEDWQEIIKWCYRCDGGGQAEDRYGDYGRCHRCGGTGIYDQFWVRLERWRLAGHVFHRPAEKRYKRPEAVVTIKGHVEHAYHGRASGEAALWLALIFDRRLFRRLMTSGWPMGSTWPYPLETLRKLTGRLGMLRSKFERRACGICGRGYRQGFRAWRSWSCVCGPCDRGQRPDKVDTDKGSVDIPF